LAQQLFFAIAEARPAHAPAKETARRLLVAKVNTEEVPTLGYRFRCFCDPDDGVVPKRLEVARQAGAMPAPQIRKFIEQAQVNQQ
jgi:hypothetical protein